MTQVRFEVIIHGPKRSKRVSALFNTGAKAVFMRDDIADELGYERIEPLSVPLAVRGMAGEVIGKSPVDIELDGIRLPYTSFVVKDLAEELIIGTSFMEQFEVELDLREGATSLPHSCWGGGRSVVMKS